MALAKTGLPFGFSKSAKSLLSENMTIIDEYIIDLCAKWRTEIFPCLRGP